MKGSQNIDAMLNPFKLKKHVSFQILEVCSLVFSEIEMLVNEEVQA